MGDLEPYLDPTHGVIVPVPVGEATLEQVSKALLRGQIADRQEAREARTEMTDSFERAEAAAAQDRADDTTARDWITQLLADNATAVAEARAANDRADLSDQERADAEAKLAAIETRAAALADSLEGSSPLPEPVVTTPTVADDLA